MPIHGVPWLTVAFGAAVLLGGCVGKPQTFYAAKPIVLEPRVTPRIAARAVHAAPVASAPNPTAPVLTAAEKERLFQKFQSSQRLKDRAVTTIEAPP
jgi:hypothetical protein